MKGAIIGDIIGSVYEFDNIKTKNFPLWDEKNGFFTDDSVMTIAVMDALLHRGSAKNDSMFIQLVEAYMRAWGQAYPGRGYGGHFLEWLLDDNAKPYYSCGNGSAMRVSPVAMAANSLEEAEHLALLTALPTHNHPDGIAGAQASAGAVYLALHGAGKEEIKTYVEQYYPMDFTLDEIRPKYHFGHREELNVGTVPYAVEAFLEATDFEDCIRNVVSIGGDTDTLAAIAGPIAEAFFGIPDALWEKAKTYMDERTLDRIDKFYQRFSK